MASVDGMMIPMKQPSFWWIIWQSWVNLNARRLVAREVDLAGKNVVMTGGNSGLGREAALYFARCGASIHLACREEVAPHEVKPDDAIEELQAVAKERGHLDSEFSWAPCDLGKLDSVGEFAKRYLATGEPIDLLILNAGMKNSKWGATNLTDDGFEIIHQVKNFSFDTADAVYICFTDEYGEKVNFIAQALLMLLLLPAIAKAKAPRIVCTTSAAHYYGIFNLQNSNEGKKSYANNKLYFQAWITEFQSRLLKSDEYKHITIQGIHPGIVQTGLLKGDGEGGPKFGLLLRIILKLVHYFCCITPQQGSIAIINAATVARFGPNPTLQGVGAAEGRGGGKYMNRIWEGSPMPQTRDPQCRLMLWEFVAEELSLNRRGLLKSLGD